MIIFLQRIGTAEAPFGSVLFGRQCWLTVPRTIERAVVRCDEMILGDSGSQSFSLTYRYEVEVGDGRMLADFDCRNFSWTGLGLEAEAAYGRIPVDFGCQNSSWTGVAAFLCLGDGVRY